jgi:citrate lyase subunit beta / citryl-CoA lyase
LTLRSYLYAPGNRPELFDKALRSGADGVILDLEDSILPGEKTAALQHVVNYLSDQDQQPTEVGLWVRVNNRPGLLEEELTALAGSERLAGVSLPKVEAPGVFDRVEQLLPKGVGVVALIESASGVVAMTEIASHPRVRRLGLGEAALIAHLRMSPSPEGIELMPIRVDLVVTSRAAGIEQPVGPVFVDIGDERGLARSSQELRRLGFGGRSAIHPKQVDVINRAFTPTQSEIEQAEKLVRSVAEGIERDTAVFVDSQGRMIDAAVVRSARHILDVAKKLGILDEQTSEKNPTDRKGPAPKTNVGQKEESG